MNSSLPASGRTDASRSSAAFRHALAATAIGFVCLGVWTLSPIYPDEIAYRQQFGRVIADHGVVYGLYEMCPSNIKTVPLVLEPVAWMLAQTMRILSPPEIRILSFTAVLAVVFTTVRHVAGSRNPAAGYIVLGSFVGIAGASLIFFRYEFGIEVQLLSCLVAAARLTRRRTGVPGDLGAAIGLLFGAALSVWSHPQGLLFLPLSSYLLLRIAVRRFGSIGSLAGVAPLALFVPPALTLHHSVCTEHPQIEAYWRESNFDASNLGVGHLTHLLFDGARVYVHSFLYVTSFPLHFLPGVDATNGVMKATNLLVSVVIVFLGGLALCVPLLALFRCFKSFRLRRGGIALSELVEKNQPFVIAALITGPAVFLFVYDPLHAFYRNSYLNHFAAVAACLIFASLSGGLAVRATKGACAIMGIAVAASLIFNAFLFVPRLRAGFEGPSSLSVYRNWSQVAHDTEELARQCKMDLQRGRIIVDDLTQAGVFSRPMTIPVTYLDLQASYIGMSVHDAAISVKANYAILRCAYFGSLGVEPQGKTGEICCYSFNY
jgi:hypothetical protein